MVFWSIFAQALTITWFVAMMMVLVEYLNVLSVDRLRAVLCDSHWLQYLVAVVLGATPGCLGAFIIVSLYIHRSVRLGALVACMIATSGDEAFVMLAIFPRTALLLTVGLAVVGIVAGLLTDLSLGSAPTERGCDEMVMHHDAASCKCFDPVLISQELRHPSAARGTLAISIALFMLALLSGSVGPAEWNWIRVTLVAVGFFALFIVATVPEHFIEEHLWRHIALQHVPRIFLWTLGAMVLVAVFNTTFEGRSLLRDNLWLTLSGAAALGLIPESGPHLLIVMLYKAGSVPISILATNSIVQDGHGMLPLLAYSWRDFLKVKTINLVAGLLAGILLLLAGY